MSYFPPKTVDSSFTTTALLASGATYDSGILDCSDYTQLQTQVTASHDGTLEFIFFADAGGTDQVRSLTLPYVAANGYQLYGAPVFSQYVQYKFTNDGGVTQTDFYYETKFSKEALSPQVLRVDAPMAGGMMSTVGRNVLVGEDDAGAYTNVKIDSGSKALKTKIVGPLSGFGEVQVAQIVPQTQLMFPYGVNPLLVDTRNNGGSTSTGNGKITCSTGAAANQSGGFVSRNIGKYNAGQGHIARFTGVFTTGVADNTQYVGIGDAFEGFFFGYNGTDFGSLHRKGGRPEIRTLTVSTKSTTAENITITLDGDADATVAVTDATAGDTTTTANEIADHDYSNLGDGWTARAVGSTVVFTSWSSGSKAGTYTLSGATTAVGTIAQTLAGVAATNTFTAQTAWSDDVADGSGALPAMDWTKGNVFQIQFQYLGYGAIEYYVEDPASGDFLLCHRIPFANTSIDPSLENASLPLSAVVTNAANATDITLSLASMMSGSEGIDRLAGIRRGASGTQTGIATTEVPVLSIRNQEVFNGVPNKIPVKINTIKTANDHNQSMIIRVYSNIEKTAASFSDVETNVSPIAADTAATAVDNSTGRLIYSKQLGSQENDTIDLSSDPLAGNLEVGDTFTVTAETVSGTGGACAVSLNWVEEQ